MKDTVVFSINAIIRSLLFGIVLCLQLIDAGPLSTNVRLQRSSTALDVSLKTPSIGALTQNAKIAGSWERCMIVAPITIQLLGQLLLVSSTKDVSFRDIKSDAKFTLIKHPDSLRATLLQVSHEGYHAFLSAHSTMNTIQLSMIQIPKHIKTALKILAGNYPHRVLKRLLPLILGNIRATGDECVSVSNATAVKFTEVMKLIQEVVRTTSSTQSVHEKQVEENERKLQLLRDVQEKLAIEEKRRAQQYKEATEAANRAEETYYQALRDIPTGWEAFFQDLGRGVLKFANNVAKVGAPMLARGVGQMISSVVSSIRSKRSTADGGKRQPVSFGFGQTVDMARRFADQMKELRQLLASDNVDVKKIDGFATVCKVAQEYVGTLPKNAAKSHLLQLIKRADRVGNRAAKNAKQHEPNSTIEEDILRELQEISNELQILQTANQLTDPNSGSSVQSSGLDHGNDDSSSRNEVLKARIAQSTLIEQRKRQDVYAAELSALLQQVRDTSSKIISIDLTTINYREIIKMLEKAFNLLEKLQQQWNHFVLFFQDLSVQVKNMVQHSLKRFLDVASVGDDDLDIAYRMQLIRNLKGDTFSIHSEAYTLYVLSRTYYDVSSKYLMGRLSSLSNMLVSRSETERTALKEQLQKDAEETLEQINGLIREREAAFDKELNTRQTEVTELLERLGGPTIDDQRIIDEANQLINADNADNAWGDQ